MHFFFVSGSKINSYYFCTFSVEQVVVTLHLVGDREPAEVVGDLSVCLDGMQVDPELLTNGDASSTRSK